MRSIYLIFLILISLYAKSQVDSTGRLIKYATFSDTTGMLLPYTRAANIKTINSQSLLGTGNITVSASPGGANTQVQFNDAGALNGVSGFTFNKTTNTVALDSSLIITKGFLNLGSTTQGKIYLGPTGSGNVWFKISPASTISLGASQDLKLPDAGANGIFIGDGAGVKHVTGNSEIGIGKVALSNDSSGVGNVFICASCTIKDGTFNAVIGSESFQNGTSATKNATIGFRVLNAATTATLNSAMGNQAGETLSTGINNVLIGAYSGKQLTDGSSNTFLGYGAGFQYVNVSNKFAIANSFSAINDLMIGDFQSTANKLGVNYSEGTTLNYTFQVNGKASIVTVDSTAAGRNLLYQDADGLIKKTAIPDLSTKVNISDTANMLGGYLRKTGVVTEAQVTNLTTDLSGKQATLVSATNIKTINGNSILGSGDLSISAGFAWGNATGTLSNQTDLQNALNAKLSTNGSAASLTSIPVDQATGILPFANGGRTGSASTSATTGTMTVNMATSIITITPTGNCTFNASGGTVGQIVTFIITTSGTTSFTLTFGTNYRKVSTLATGTTSARFFSVSFVCVNGTIWQEIARTAAQT